MTASTAGRSRHPRSGSKKPRATGTLARVPPQPVYGTSGRTKVVLASAQLDRASSSGNNVRQDGKGILVIDGTVAGSGRAQKTPDSTVQRERRLTGTSKPSSSRKPRTIGQRRTEEYVYGLISQAEPEDIDLDRFEDDSNDEVDDRRQKSNSDRGTATQRPNSKSAKLGPVALATVDENDELGPLDSVSQIGRRRRLKRSLREPSRPSIQRSPTTSSKLTAAKSPSVPRPSSKVRSATTDTSFWASFWPRRPTSTAPATPRTVECLTCGSDDVLRSQSAKLACGHRFCHDCLKRVFEMSVKDPSHMPPKCCTQDHIPLQHAQSLFDEKFKKLWNRKYQEYTTKNKIYCPKPKCGHWIRSRYIKTNSNGRRYAQCSRCQTKVCPTCSNKLHQSGECPKDPAIVALTAQARREGWQACYSCRALVELREGCNHMTCRCTAEFCMRCAAKWKTCECPLFGAPPDVLIGRAGDARGGDRVRAAAIHAGVLDLLGRAADAAVGAHAAAVRDRGAEDVARRRRRQERQDAEIAERLQVAMILEA